MSCIFCMIANGESPCYKIYEDEYTLAFLDIARDVDGHTVVIPKKHFTSVLDCDEETLNHIIATVKKVGCHYVNNCGYQGFNVMNASEPSAQQSVSHLHFHVIPRRENDGLDTWPHFAGSKSEIAVMHEVLKMK